MVARPRTSMIKVGLLTTVSITLLVLVLIWLKGRGFSSGPTDTVLFTDVDGLREGAPVQLMGIRVGFVDTVVPIQKDGRYYVRVTFNLNQNLGITIPKGSHLAIEQAGIIGEKFLEITPPQLREVALSTFQQAAAQVTEGLPVKFVYAEGYKNVGRVERVDTIPDGQLMRHKLYYRITVPGAEMPQDPVYELTLMDDGTYALVILPREPLLAHVPDKNLKYTIENPMRIKRFLEIQMESAEALKLTNDKINQLLSDETIDTLNSTLKNTEVLTARATEVMDSANDLFKTTGRDLETLVTASSELAENVNAVSKNINDVIGDPKLKQDVISTVHSIEASSKALSDILKDPALRETLSIAREASQNTNELVAALKDTAGDKELQARLERVIALTETSLNKLSVVMTRLDDVTGGDKENLKGILEDTRETAENMKVITGKFNKRFTLFRLLF